MLQRSPRINELLFATAIRPVELAGDIESLSAFARTAFVLGMVDAFEYRPMKDSYDVMKHLFPHGWHAQRYHRVKFRQVYGAGYDMARGHLFLEESGRQITENTISPAEVLVINDGTVCWGAPRADLIDAMKRLGWVREGDVWIEPASDEDDDTQPAYTALCEAVTPLPGLNGAGGDKPDWDLYPSLTYTPHVGRRHWVLG